MEEAKEEIDSLRMELSRTQLLNAELQSLLGAAVIRPTRKLRHSKLSWSQHRMS